MCASSAIIAAAGPQHRTTPSVTLLWVGGKPFGDCVFVCGERGERTRENGDKIDTHSTTRGPPRQPSKEVFFFVFFCV